MIELKKKLRLKGNRVRNRFGKENISYGSELFGDRLSKKSESAKGCSRYEVCNLKKNATFSIKILRTHILTAVPKVLH